MSTQETQFQQNVAAAQDQVEKVSARARQATRQTVDAVRQGQETAARTTERLTQQGNQVASTAFDAAWESWMAALGMISWSQDQAEQVARQLMEQGRISREEGRRLLQELGTQAKRNQEELQRMIQESVRASLQSFQFPESFFQPLLTMMTPPPTTQDATAASRTQLDELNRKVDELSRKLDALNAKAVK